MEDLLDEIRQLKIAQFEQAVQLHKHAERLSKLEKRPDDGIRSLWSSPSPLPTFAQRTPR